MENPVLSVENLTVSYDGVIAVKDVNINFLSNKISSLMGPSGCGKTTLLRCLNRIHELYHSVRIEGKILFKGQDIFQLDPILVRRKIGMVFQRPNPFPTMSIYQNVLAGYRLNGIRLSKKQADQIVEESLRMAGLWDEVKDNLLRRGSFLSGGQQQRLCIARALALKPDVLLMDEPTSALDPIAMARIEELLVNLKTSVTIIIVTHNLAQAGRISDYTSFMYLGRLIETGLTATIFTSPQKEETEKYLTGRLG